MRITHKETYPNFRVGDRVRAISGWADGQLGIITDIRPWLAISFNHAGPFLYNPEAVEHIDEFAVWVREVRTNAGL